MRGLGGVMLYFAYGSNMNWPRMQRRCPSAKFVTTAVLPDHQLAFPRTSKRGGGVAGVVPAPGATVWGAVYEISEPDLRVLDGKEGFFGPDRVDNHYNRLECRVYEKGDPNRPLQVVIYLAVPVPGTHPPRREYVDLIIGGARHWGLPADYIRKLEGFAEE